MTKAKILVVDDENHIRMFYHAELQKEGYDVKISDGSDSIPELLKCATPDVVILDIKLGDGRSGLDLLQQIRVHDQSLPVILCSSYENYHDDPKSVSATDFVVKSVDLSNMKKKIKHHLQKNEPALPEDLSFILAGINSSIYHGSLIQPKSNTRTCRKNAP